MTDEDDVPSIALTIAKVLLMVLIVCPKLTKYYIDSKARCLY